MPVAQTPAASTSPPGRGPKRTPATRGGAIGRGGGWPVLLLVLAVLLIPTACVCWFILAAVQSERLAVRQRLTDIYQSQLLSIRDKVAADFQSRIDKIALPSASPPEQFATIVSDGIADSAIIFSDEGQRLYPVDALPEPASAAATSSSAAEEARIHEAAGEFNRAARGWGAIAKESSSIDTQARALQAQSRCLYRARDVAAATALLRDLAADPKFQNVRDSHGRLISADAALRLVELTGDPLDNLYHRITRYDAAVPLLPSSQRLFLLQRYAGMTRTTQPLAQGEELAAALTEQVPPFVPASSDALQPTPVANLYALSIPSGRSRVLALFTEESITRMTAAAAREVIPSTGTVCLLTLSHADAPLSPVISFIDIPAGKYFPRGWRLELYLPPGDPAYAQSLSWQRSHYLWTGALSIAAILSVALILGLYLQRQQRLTALKNDLIATVSHELKTPLASMRLLVETLQDHRVTSDAQRADYLALIARENARLTRLIDNFLSFSRMERNKRQFARDPLPLHNLLHAAVEAMGDRASAVTLEPGPNPTILGDRDALVTALLNLLDNAWKYSSDPRHITLRTTADKDTVSIAVADQGIGIPRRHLRRIFDRFYQVDRSLTRTAGGTGLGLAIVKFIVEGHHGSIDVTSTPNKGSTFTLRLPLEGPS